MLGNLFTIEEHAVSTDETKSRVEPSFVSSTEAVKAFMAENEKRHVCACGKTFLAITSMAQHQKDARIHKASQQKEKSTALSSDRTIHMTDDQAQGLNHADYTADIRVR